MRLTHLVAAVNEHLGLFSRPLFALLLDGLCVDGADGRAGGRARAVGDRGVVVAGLGLDGVLGGIESHLVAEKLGMATQ